MSGTLTTLLIAIVAAQVGVVIIYHQKAGDKLHQLKYQYGLEALKLEKRIEGLQASILSYHDKIDTVKAKIEEME